MSQFSLLYPWMLLCLPLPWLVYRYTPAFYRERSSVQVPFFARLAQAMGQAGQQGSVIINRQKLQKIALILTWITLCFCLARPVALGQTSTINKQARDLMIALDLSQSMEQVDFTQVNGKKISRIEGLKHLIDQFVQQRQGDRIGLIVFGSGAYLQVPFTQDLSMWQQLLAQLDTRMAGPATAIGDAIGLSIRAFEDSHSDNRMLLLVTDGSDNASRLAPTESAQLAASENIAVFTVGMGDTSTSGQDKVDFAQLEAVAQMTGGKAFLAEDEAALQKVLQAVNQLQPSVYQIEQVQPKRDIYFWVLAPAIIFYLLIFFGLTLAEIWQTRKGYQHDQ